MLNKLVVNRFVDNFAASVPNAALAQELSSFRVNPVFYCRGVRTFAPVLRKFPVEAVMR